DREAQLVAVLALLAGPARAYPCIVHEDIETVVVALHALGQCGDRVERREVGALPVEVLVPRRATDLGDRLPAARVVAAVEDHPCARFGQGRRDSSAQSVGRTPDEDCRHRVNVLGNIKRAFVLSRGTATNTSTN